MDLVDIPLSLKVLSCTPLLSLMLAGSLAPVTAQAFQPVQINQQRSLAMAQPSCGYKGYKQLIFERPKQKLPGRREPELYRCGGFTPPIPLTALMPESNLGLTTVARPTFFWYLPKTSIQEAEFVLMDREEQPLYRMTISIKGKSGILSLKLPAQAPALELDKAYRWQFELLTDTDVSLREGNPSVAGWIVRKKPAAEFLNQVQAAALRDRPTLYAQSGIWHETLTSLMEVACAQPNDPTLKADWKELLQSVQLPKLAQSTSISCQSKDLGDSSNN